MKKMSLVLLSAASLLSASAFAGSSLSDYYSTKHPAPSMATKLMHPPVDITIINASTRSIHAVVPNTEINDTIFPTMNYHLVSYNPNISSTYMVLQDPMHKTFFANNVCKFAIITVYGMPNHYTTMVDSDLCR